MSKKKAKAKKLKLTSAQPGIAHGVEVGNGVHGGGGGGGRLDGHTATLQLIQAARSLGLKKAHEVLNAIS